MAIRHALLRGPLRSDSFGAAAAAATAALVTRAAFTEVASGIGPTLLTAGGACAALEVAAALVRARASAGPLSRARAGALARLAVALVAALVASALSSGGGAERTGGSELAACFAALLLVVLALPAAPMAGGRLLEAELARRRPQLVAARLAARLGFTAALAGPGVLLLLPRIRADLPARVALPILALLLIGGARRARADAFERELALQARSDGSGLSASLRARLLATPLDPDVAALRPLTAEQFRAFRDELERRGGRT